MSERLFEERRGERKKREGGRPPFSCPQDEACRMRVFNGWRRRGEERGGRGEGARGEKRGRGRNHSDRRVRDVELLVAGGEKRKRREKKKKKERKIALTH